MAAAMGMVVMMRVLGVCVSLFKMDLCWKVLLSPLLSLFQIYRFNFFWLFYTQELHFPLFYLGFNLPVGYKNIFLYFTLCS